MTAENHPKRVVEAALMAADEPLALGQLQKLFADRERPDTLALQQILDELGEDYAGAAVELRQVASGWRFQVRSDYGPYVARLWEEKPGRYSRAMLETLALIAYRQPITRGEIEDVRGVTVSTSIMRALEERGWIQVLGRRDVPGRPALWGTTRAFLDYFNLRSLDELPSLTELRDYEQLNAELDFGDDGSSPAGDGRSGKEADAEDTG